MQREPFRLRITSRRGRCTLAVFGVLMALVSTLSASERFLSTMQADKPEEFDAYLEVITAKDPYEVVSKAAEFVAQWPRSQLGAHVYYMQLEAYRNLDDANQAIAAGEKALAATPDNLAVLASLASILPNDTNDPARIDRAEECAQRILEVLENFRIPRWVALQDWETYRGGLRSAAHAALGMVAYQRGDTRQAIEELETAVTLSAIPDPVQYYRLGLLYEAAGDRAAAIRSLTRAANLNNDRVRDLAKQRLKGLSQAR